MNNCKTIKMKMIMKNIRFITNSEKFLYECQAIPRIDLKKEGMKKEKAP